MGITINAENLDDACDKLRLREQHYGIRIRWRKDNDLSDWGRAMLLPGCIVNAVGLPGQEVEQSFTTAGEALRYLAKLLKMVDATARNEKAKRDQEARNRARLAKAKASQ